MKLHFLTVAAGKRLIGKAVAVHPAVLSALKSGTVAIIAGTTNGYAAEEILRSIGQAEGFTRRKFFRGITLPPERPVTAPGRLPDEGEFPGDVIIERGEWQKGKTIFDAVDSLKSGDVILKGANALDLATGQAAILIGHPKAGTIGVALQAVVGRRVRLILPVGLEKRVSGNLASLSARLSSPDAEGSRLLPVPGETLTELDAVSLLTGAEAELASAGGICGAEGGVWLVVSGTAKQMEDADTLLRSVASEPPFDL
jgi:hypothetical protein